MEYKEWRKLYKQQVEFEGWMLAHPFQDRTYIIGLSISPGPNIVLRGFDSNANAEEYVKYRAIADRDPAAIHALEIIDSERIADKLSK